MKKLEFHTYTGDVESLKSWFIGGGNYVVNVNKSLSSQSVVVQIDNGAKIKLNCGDSIGLIRLDDFLLYKIIPNRRLAKKKNNKI